MGIPAGMLANTVANILYIPRSNLKYYKYYKYHLYSQDKQSHLVGQQLLLTWPAGLTSDHLHSLRSG